MIYTKLNKARARILESKIFKDAKGYNFKYIDLPQIEPEVIKACDEVGVCPWVYFEEGKACLDLFDAEDGTSLHLDIAMDSSMCKASQAPIQSVGAMMTYARRYLYMTAFAISEHDQVDDVENVQRAQVAEETIKEEKPTEFDTLRRDYLVKEMTDILPDAVDKLVTATKGAKSIDDIPTEKLEAAYKRLKKRQEELA